MGNVHLAILTDNQRKALLYHVCGHSFAQTAEKMGASPYAVRRWYAQASRSFQEYRLYHDPKLEHDQPVSLSLTRGELSFLLDVLTAHSREMIKKVGGRRHDIDWRSSLTYSSQLLEELFSRAYAAYYGKPADFKLF